MSDINIPKFDVIRDFMRRHRRSKKQWDQPPLNVTSTWLDEKIQDNAWPIELTLEIWNKIKDSEIESEKRREEFIILRDADANDAFISDSKDLLRDIEVPCAKTTSWVRFTEKISANPLFDEQDIITLEASAHKVLGHLKANTKIGQPVKGLVIGQVQSGKTTNIAALMNMAADWGFNMFIVLTGRIESLRKQTHERIKNDLCSGNPIWIPLGGDLRSNAEVHQLRDLHFGPDNRQRYFAVVLKNCNRLTNLLGWLESYPTPLGRMQLLVIDDESDEAGINVGNVTDESTRSAVNELIIKIVNIKALAVNYVGYTATPYANVLNESPGPKTLYPSSFIRSLPSNDKYFGPKEIFGIEGDSVSPNELNSSGLDIVRVIPSHTDSPTHPSQNVIDEVEIVKSLQNGAKNQINEANSLKTSIAWFLCATATRRYWNETRPTTMLVHTSQKQSHHENLADSIKEWLTTSPTEVIIDLCRKVWSSETDSFTLETLRSQYPDYRFLDSVRNYPEFLEIQPHLSTLISKVGAIKIDSQGNIDHHNGIHICIDNCAQSGITDEGEHVRLLYPEDDVGFSTSFIVVGGATLSRGLTLQGLVSTYFLRHSSLGDSLLQMGRWFGYRIGYELLPRLWMTKETADKFRWFAGVEQSLREELKRYERAGASPALFGPRVQSHPLVSWLRITAPKRMQSAEAAKWDFAGITNQTTMFVNKSKWLEDNIGFGEEFLAKLKEEAQIVRNAIVYRSICSSQIELFLKRMNFHRRNMVFKEIDVFINWYKEFHERAGYTAWNVVVAGLDNALECLPQGEDPEKWWRIPGGFVKKVNRTRQGDFQLDGSFSIGALLSPRDRLGDIEGPIPNGPLLIPNISKVRSDRGLGSTPLLILYRIDMHSKYVGTANNRRDLSTCRDILGVAMIIPGERNVGGLVKQVSVRVNPTEIDNGDITD
jgi:hypothetical protein